MEVLSPTVGAPTLTVEQRLDRLAAEQATLQSSINQAADRIAEDLRRDLSQESNRLREDDSSLRDLLAVDRTSGIRRSVIGATLFGIGVLCSAVANLVS